MVEGGAQHQSIDDCLQVLSKTMDSTTLSPDKIELSTIRKDEENDEVGYIWTTHGHCFVLHVQSKCAVTHTCLASD